MPEQILPEALDRLEKLALQATSGPWLVWDDGDIGTAYPVTRKRRRRGSLATDEVVVESLHIANTSEPDASYLAAVDPNTIVAMIARLRYLEAICENVSAHPTLIKESQWSELDFGFSDIEE